MAVSSTKRLPGAVKRWLRSTASPLDVERAEQIFYIKYLEEGMTVFDVGANVGELSLLFSRFVGEGKVHAFEPSRNGFERLTTVYRAGAVRPNIILNNLALVDKEGTVGLHVYGEELSSWSSLGKRPLANYGIDVAPTRVEEIPATTVDAYCERNGISRIDLLKIDVEGAEHQVLLGARRMLRAKRIRCATFEFGQTTFDMGNTPDDIEAYLGGLGYRLRNVVKGDPVFPGRESAASARFSMHVATPR